MGKHKVILGGMPELLLRQIIGNSLSLEDVKDIFKFVQKGIDKNGKVRGYFTGTGVKPNFASKLEKYGIHLSDELYNWRMKV